MVAVKSLETLSVSSSSLEELIVALPAWEYRKGYSINFHMVAATSLVSSWAASPPEDLIFVLLSWE